MNALAGTGLVAAAIAAYLLLLLLLGVPRLGRLLARSSAATSPVPPCHCGQRLPAPLVAYCSKPCQWADDDHGPNGDDQ